jgi:hypothetical protein
LNRFAIPIGVLIMGAIFFGILGDVGFRDLPVPDAEVDATVPPDLGPPIEISVDAFIHRLDAEPLPPPKDAFEALARYGVFGRGTEDLDRFLKRGGMIRQDKAPEGARAYRDHGTLLTLKIEGGVVTALRADFDDQAASASLTALSWVACNERDHIRLHWDQETPGGALLTGSFPQDDGRTFHYRGMMRSSGEPPYGPAYIELSDTPFK